MFDQLPLAALISDRFLAMHGGICPELRTLEDINRIDRFQEPTGTALDMLWSCPVTSPPGFTFINSRGCGYSFGPDALLPFLKANRLYTLIRGHTVQSQGYFQHQWKKSALKLPQVIALFSAPDYQGQNNLGAYLRIQDRKLDVYQLKKGATGPFYPPDF